MKKELLMAAGVALATLALALALIRYFAPTLLGVPVDLRLVQLAETQPAFFAGIFRMEDIRSLDLNVNDPIMGVRGKPLHANLVLKGPNDVLGFRNANVPNVADILAIGDSQTYGLNASMPLNWPHQLDALLSRKHQSSRVYSMAVGGWSAPQYLHAAQIAGVLRPRVMIVAFYAGNDALESFIHAYGSEHWAHLRPDGKLRAADAPSVQLPVPRNKQWHVPLDDGLGTIMLVDLRRASMRDHIAVDAGWQIMKLVATQLSEQAAAYQAHLLVALIPTKESAYAKLLHQRGVQVPQEFAELLAEESLRSVDFASHVTGLPGTQFIDVATPMQDALLAGEAIYPGDFDGHPNAAGYERIAASFERAAAALVPSYPCGPVRFESRDGLWHHAIASGDGHYWLLDTPPDGAVSVPTVTINERMVEGMRQLPEAPGNREHPRCG